MRSLFHFGIVLISLSVLLSVVAVAVLKIKYSHLKKKLDEEYGPAG